MKQDFPLAIYVPTVVGREAWLVECLRSIQVQNEKLKIPIIVSGNGTLDLTRQVSTEFGAEFVHRPARLRAEEHWRRIIVENTADYLWVIGDDDRVAPGALDIVKGLIAEQERSSMPLLGIIGRVRYFFLPDASDLQPVRPDDTAWNAGKFTSLREVADATRGENRFGAFLFKSNLFSVEMLDRYEGTEHAIFGAFWEGLAQTSWGYVAVVDEPLIHMRQAEKEWDASRTAVRLGVKKYVELIPPEVARYRVHLNSHLSLRKALDLASRSLSQEKEILKELVNRYKTFSVGAKSLVKLPPSIAKLFLVSFEFAVRCSDWVYIRTLKRWRRPVAHSPN